MQNIPLFEQVFNKGKEKTLQVCLSEFCDHCQLLFIILYFQVTNINPHYNYIY